MKTQTKDFVVRIILTPILILGFVLNRVYDTFFGWWFGPLVQKRENQALWDDVQANLYFLYTKGQPLKEKWPRPLPFDYASVYLTYENLRFCFTRGRGDSAVSLSPRHAPKDSHQLEMVIAALDCKNIAHVPACRNLAEAAELIRPHLDDMNRAFSETQYPKFRNLP